jgi:hypothetical protein
LIGRNFYIQVSAKHLTLALSVFKNILAGGWKEDAAYLQKGLVDITTERQDIEALFILLRVIHCQNQHVPRKLSLEMLAKVAVLAGFYQCKEGVGNILRIFDYTVWLWISLFF